MLVPASRWLFRLLGGSTPLHLPPHPVWLHFGCPCFGGNIRQLQGGAPALCCLLTTQKPRAEPHSTFYPHIGMPALFRKQKQMPQGRLATIKQCIMEPEDTVGEWSFKAKVKMLSLRSWMTKSGSTSVKWFVRLEVGGAGEDYSLCTNPVPWEPTAGQPACSDLRARGGTHGSGLNFLVKCCGASGYFSYKLMCKGFNCVLGNPSVIVEGANAAACHCVSQRRNQKQIRVKASFGVLSIFFRAWVRACWETCLLWQGPCADPGYYLNLLGSAERLYGLQKERVEQRHRSSQQFCCRTGQSEAAQREQPAGTTTGGRHWWQQLMANLASVSNPYQTPERCWCE